MRATVRAESVGHEHRLDPAHLLDTHMHPGRDAVECLPPTQAGNGCARWSYGNLDCRHAATGNPSTLPTSGGYLGKNCTGTEIAGETSRACSRNWDSP